MNNQEMQSRVLAELEEMRFDNVFALLNTVLNPTNDLAEVIAFSDAISVLINDGYIVIGTAANSPRDEIVFASAEGLQFAAKLNSWFRFDSDRNIWTYSGGDLRRARIPFLLITERGLRRSREILTERGYRWWTQ